MKNIKNPLIVEAEHWNKLIKFVKYCSDQELYMKKFIDKYAIDFKDNIDNKATELLKEIGEFE